MVELEKTKVFIVGCEESFSENIRKVLEEKQYLVAISQSVKNAMLVASAQIFDLVLISWDNSEMPGAEVLKTLRKDRRYIDVPALFVIDPTHSPELFDHIDDGVYDFVKLPIYGPELTTRIDNLLKVREFYRQIIREKKELKDELIQFNDDIVQYKHEVELPFYLMLDNIRCLTLPQDINDQTKNYVGSVVKAAELLNQLQSRSNIDLLKNGHNHQTSHNAFAGDFSINEILDNIIELIRPHLDEQKCRITVLKRECIPTERLKGDSNRFIYILLYYFASVLSQVKNSILAIDVNVDLKSDDPQLGFRIICPDSGVYCYELKGDPKRSFLNCNAYSITFIENYVRKLGGAASVDSLESSIAYRFMLPIKLISTEFVQPEHLTTVKSKILVVDDNPFNQKILSMLLRKLNMEFDLATNGLKAVEFFKINKYTCVLMDIFMPEMDGLEAARVIRKIELERGTYTKIIAISASTSDHMMKVCLEAGMNDYLAKPFTIEILKEKLEELDVNI